MGRLKAGGSHGLWFVVALLLVLPGNLEARFLGGHEGLAAGDDSCRACHPGYPDTLAIGAPGVVDMPSGGGRHLASRQARLCWLCHRVGNPFAARPLDDQAFGESLHGSGAAVAAPDSWLAGEAIEEEYRSECWSCPENPPIVCTTCHDVHEGRSTMFLRFSDASGDYSQLCLSCHAGRFNPGLLGEDNILVRDREAYSSHPVERCSTCHTVHGPPPSPPPLSALAGPASRDELCRRCHQVPGHGRGGLEEGHAEFPGRIAGQGLLKSPPGSPSPWAPTAHFDEGSSPFDAASARALPCTACHDLHGGLPMTPLLYGPSSVAGGFGDWCLNCHNPPKEGGEGGTGPVGKTPGPRSEIVDSLIEAYRIDDRDVRRLSAWAAERIALDEAMREEMLSRWAGAGEAERRTLASLFALGRIGDRRALPALVMALEAEGEEVVQGNAREILNGIREGVFVDRLFELLLDERQPARQSAARSLAAMRPAGTGERVAPALRDPRWDAREKAARIIAATGDPEARLPLEEALDDERSEVRSAAVAALGTIANPASVPKLIDRLFDDSTEVKVAALRALAKVPDPRAFEALVSLTKEPKKEIRDEVLDTLATIKDYRILPVMLKGMEEKLVNQLAWKAAISRIEAPEAFDYLLEAVRPEMGRLVRKYTVPVIARYRGDRAMEALVDVFLNDVDGPVRMKAALYLANIDYERALEPFLSVLLDRDSPTRDREAVIDFLLVKEDSRVVEPLISVLDDPTDSLARKANAALWKMTCTNYGLDAGRWNEWWEESRETFKFKHCR